MDWLVAFLIVGGGSFLAFRRSTWIVDYTIFVIVFNRGLRRLLDWQAGAFNPFSPISLTPLLVAALMTLPFLWDFHRLPRWAMRMFQYLLLAIGYAFLIGLVRVKFAAVYALAEMLGPVALLGFVFVSQASDAVRDRWIRSFSWCAILASAYGWYQYLTIPPWDAFWVEAVGFVGYLGVLEPTKMTVFSTMAERGPLAGFLGFAVVPMIVSPRWRTICSWPGVILVFSVILLTLSRGGIILACLSTLIFVLVNRGAQMLQISVAVAIIGGTAWFGIEKMPNAEKIQNRFETLKSMEEDGSFQGRAQIFSTGWRTILFNPIGYGLGAGGLAGRVNSGSLEGQAVVADAGYLEIIATFGWLGTGCLFFGLYTGWRALSVLNQMPLLRTPHVLLARAFIISMIPACFAGNFLAGISLFWLAIGCALSPRPELIRVYRRQRVQSAEPTADGAKSGAQKA